MSLIPCICPLFALPGDYGAGPRAAGEQWIWHRIFPPQDPSSGLEAPLQLIPGAPEALREASAKSRRRVAGGAIWFPPDSSLIFLLPLTHFHGGDARE